VIRAAAEADIADIVRIINLAYRVEDFFIEGDRTDDDGVRAMLASGRVLVLDEDGAVTGCVYLKLAGDRGYFGPLAVDPTRQGGGRARALIVAVEDECRAAGARHLDLTIVSVRPELAAFYERFGFRPDGTAPFSDGTKLKMPCHFILYSKRLDDA